MIFKAFKEFMVGFLFESHELQSFTVIIAVVRQQFVTGINCSIFLHRNSFGANQR